MRSQILTFLWISEGTQHYLIDGLGELIVDLLALQGASMHASTACINRYFFMQW